MEADIGQQRENQHSRDSLEKPDQDLVSHGAETPQRIRHASQGVDRHPKRKARASFHGLEECLAVD